MRSLRRLYSRADAIGSSNINIRDKMTPRRESGRNAAGKGGRAALVGEGGEGTGLEVGGERSRGGGGGHALGGGGDEDVLSYWPALRFFVFAPKLSGAIAMTRAMPWILASKMGYVADMLPATRWWYFAAFILGVLFI